MTIEVTTNVNPIANIEVSTTDPQNPTIGVDVPEAVVIGVDTTVLLGPKGDPGFSPIANVSKTGTTATITITDQVGTTTATVSDGAKGDTGDSGVRVQVDEPTDPDVNVWINPNGTDTPYLTDVKVDNVSVVTNRVANLGKLASKNVVNYVTEVTNKPVIPTVNNGVLTIQKNGATVGTFSANQSTNSTVNIEADVQVNADWNATSGVAEILNKPSIPSKTSDLTNDSGYITSSYHDSTKYDASNPSGYQTSSQVNTAITSNIINDVAHTDVNKSLSANMGKELQDQITNLKSRGRFLALWNCSNGLAESDPTTSPRPYNSGDYFIVGTVATGSGTNYRPSGTEYIIGQASAVVETEIVNVDDVYYYDGIVWKLQINTKKTVAFASIAGQPYDNSNLASALNSKANESALTSHTTNTSNPHSVTKAQVGLGNVDNTSDLNKPISTATQTALNGKQATLTAGNNIGITNNTISFTGTIPTKISNLTDDTATNPIDKADTLTGLTATVSELNYTDGVTSNIQTQLNSKQATLVSGTNIKTINNTTLLGSGNISIASPTVVQIPGTSTTSVMSQNAVGNFIVSRGENLVTNGFATLGNNYNFSGLTFDGTDGYGTGGCFTRTGRMLYMIPMTDEYLPIDTSKIYEFSAFVKRDVAQPAGTVDLYFIDMYDIDKYSILDICVNSWTGTTTTLAQDLKNGDTVAYLTDTSNWSTSTASNPFATNMQVFNYQNSFGYTYPDYTRNVIGSTGIVHNAYNGKYFEVSDIDTVNNTITFSVKAWDKGTIPAGTKVAQSRGGGYYYFLKPTATTVDTWQQLKGYTQPAGYRPGTAFVRLGASVNRNTSATYKICGISFTANPTFPMKYENSKVSIGVDNNGALSWKPVQQELVSGTNIKTINSTSLLGSGNITTIANTDLSNLSATGKKTGSLLSMPSSTYTEITPGASGATYTAPANGYYFAICGGDVRIQNNASGAMTITTGATSLGGGGMFMPVQKNQTVTINYSTSSYLKIRFIYANGET